MLQSFAKMDDYLISVKINEGYEKLTIAEAEEAQKGIVPPFFLRKGTMIEYLGKVSDPLNPDVLIPAYKIFS